MSKLCRMPTLAIITIYQTVRRINAQLSTVTKSSRSKHIWHVIMPKRTALQFDLVHRDLSWKRAQHSICIQLEQRSYRDACADTSYDQRKQRVNHHIQSICRLSNLNVSVNELCMFAAYYTDYTTIFVFVFHFVWFADASAVIGKSQTDITKLLVYRKKNRGSVTHIADRLGNPEPIEGDWLVLTPKDKMPQPDKVAYPKPPKAADGSLIYERIPNKCDVDNNKANPLIITPSSATPVKRRHPEDVNGIMENSKCLFEVCLFQCSTR